MRPPSRDVQWRDAGSKSWSIAVPERERALRGHLPNVKKDREIKPRPTDRERSLEQPLPATPDSSGV